MVISAAAALLLAWATAGAADATPAKPPLGSIARQLRLRMELMKKASGTLASSLSHNRGEWERISPDQREKFRREAYAFLQQNPQEQDRLLEHYTRFIEMSAQRQAEYQARAQWLSVVAASFTPEQRKALEAMPAEQRAKALLDRKAELIAQGKLAPDAPASAPASGPATQPSAE